LTEIHGRYLKKYTPWGCPRGDYKNMGYDPKVLWQFTRDDGVIALCKLPLNWKEILHGMLATIFHTNPYKPKLKGTSGFKKKGNNCCRVTNYVAKMIQYWTIQCLWDFFLQ
jgi:hypothetical protein